MAEQEQETSFIGQGVDYLRKGASIAGEVFLTGTTLGTYQLAKQRGERQRAISERYHNALAGKAEAEAEQLKAAVKEQSDQRARDKTLNYIRNGLISHTQDKDITPYKAALKDKDTKPVVNGIDIADVALFNPNDPEHVAMRAAKTPGLGEGFWNTENNDLFERSYLVVTDNEGNQYLGSAVDFMTEQPYGSFTQKQRGAVQEPIEELSRRAQAHMTGAPGDGPPDEQKIFQEALSILSTREEFRDDAIAQQEADRKREAVRVAAASGEPQKIAEAVKDYRDAAKTTFELGELQAMAPVARRQKIVDLFKAEALTRKYDAERIESILTGAQAGTEAIASLKAFADLNDSKSAVGQVVADPGKFSPEVAEAVINSWMQRAFDELGEQGINPQTETPPEDEPKPEGEPKPGEPVAKPAVKTPPVTEPAPEFQGVSFDDARNIIATSSEEFSKPADRVRNAREMASKYAGSLATPEQIEAMSNDERKAFLKRRSRTERLLTWAQPEYMQVIGDIEREEPGTQAPIMFKQYNDLDKMMDEVLADTSLSRQEQYAQLDMITEVMEGRKGFLQNHNKYFGEQPGTTALGDFQDLLVITDLLEATSGTELGTAAESLETLTGNIGIADKLGRLWKEFTNIDLPIIATSDSGTQVLKAMAFLSALERKQLFGTATNQSDRMLESDFRPSEWKASPSTMLRSLLTKVRTQMTRLNSGIETYKGNPRVLNSARKARQELKDAGGRLIAMLYLSVPNDEAAEVDNLAKSLGIQKEMDRELTNIE